MFTYKHLIILVILNLINIIYCDVVVSTDLGQISGVEVKSVLKDEKYYSFMGIPYAQPPIGKLRFMPPVPHTGWEDVLNAKKEKPPCAQYNFPVRKIKKYGYCGDEDCLHLSVHTPAIPGETPLNLPVIVFLYNENFKISFNGSKDYGPDFFMKENVIIATINHRLGSLGFMTLGDNLLPGNNGIRDVILGLKWLNANVHHFGGDPTKITLLGSQGGATLVDILLHSPKAKGLFSGAILQSGTSLNSMYFNDKERQHTITWAENLDQSVTTSSFLLKQLDHITAVQLTDSEHLAVDADEFRSTQRAIFAFGPVIEHDHPDAVLTKLPENDMNIDVPVMIGYNSREAIEMSERYLRKPQYLTFADRDFMFLFPIRKNYRFKPQSNVFYDLIKILKDYYFEEGYVKTSKPGEYMTYLNDLMVMYPIDYTAKAYAANSSAPVFYYTFDYSGELNLRKKISLEFATTIEGTWGASVGDELCYLFVCNRIRKEYIKAIQENAEDITVLRNMVRLWTNFAKYGNPTPNTEELIWKPTTIDNKECLVISEELELKTKLNDDKIKFWDELFVKYEALAVDGVVQEIKDEL